MGASEALFKARWDLDCRRQPSRATALSELDDKRQALFPTVAHPYGLTPAQKKQLADQSPHFLESAGRRVNPQTSHLYALTSVSKLGHLVSWKSSADPVDLHNKLRSDAGMPPTWLPLATYADGPLESFRKFTWWTTRDVLDTGQPFVAGRRLGLIDDWIAEIAVIVRWKVNPGTASIHVPTCCDAYDGPVFESMDDSHDSGITIDLNISPFRSGEPEFAVSALPVEQLSIYPIKIGSELRQHLPPVLDNDTTWSRLRMYYESAL
jgi:hypothetical protein